MDLKRKVPPNPNGNPNFRRLWGNLGESSTVRLPTELHSLFKDLATAINSGKIKTTDLENQCIDRQNVERQLAALDIGKPSLEIVAPIEPTHEGARVSTRGITETIEELKERADHYRQKYDEQLDLSIFYGEMLRKNGKQEEVQTAIDEGLDLIEQFEEKQKKAWGKSPKQTGEFKTDSPRWTKYNEFKTWLKNLG